MAARLLESLGIQVMAYTRSIGPVEIEESRFDREEIGRNSLCMPDAAAAFHAEEYLQQMMGQKDSAGGVVECVVTGMPAGVGEPVFEKLDARLAHGIMSIGAVKGVEIGDGFAAAKSRGTQNNDPFRMKKSEKKPVKTTNHAGGILGGISDGDTIVLRAAFKPTPSIGASQQTVNRQGENVKIVIGGRHDPIIVPRAVVVGEAVTAFTIADMLLQSMTSRLDRIQKFFSQE